MICSNPDKTVIRGDRFMICAGTLADYYEKIGGSVEYYGKPFKQIYDFCFKIMEKKKRVLVIGDSLENDISGGLGGLGGRGGRAGPGKKQDMYNNWATPQIALGIIGFVFLFKIGEAFLGRMSIIFYKEIGFSKSDIAIYSKGLGWITTVIFTLLGGIRY